MVTNLSSGDAAPRGQRAAVARALLDVNAFVFSPGSPYTWASGIRSPIYCDNRLILGSPSARHTIIDGFTDLFRTLDPPPETIVGTATAGIPHAALLADRLGLPMGYIRSAAKPHGRGRMLEGLRPAGQSALVVEDLVSTGGSSIAAVEALRAEGLQVNSVAAIFSYGLPESENLFADHNCRPLTLTTLDELLEEAVSRGLLTEATVRLLLDWRSNPRASIA